MTPGRNVAALLCALALAGCATGTRAERHWDGGIWGDALAEQWQNPWRAAPEAALLATSFAFIPADDPIYDHYAGRSASEIPGDILAYGAVAVPLAWGGIAWARGDRGEQLETSAEALGATFLTTFFLKEVTNRERPDGSENVSFPSSHTAMAFSGATLLANFIEKDTASGSKLGYLFYLPAAYVGFNRIETNKHWATDVAAGAFLGVFLTNVIFDAHYGDEARGHEGILRPERHARWSIGPDVTDRGTGIAIHVDF